MNKADLTEFYPVLWTDLIQFPTHILVKMRHLKNALLTSFRTFLLQVQWYESVNNVMFLFCPLMWFHFSCAVCINQIQLVCHSVITCFTLYSRAHWTHSCFLTLLNSPMFVKYQFAVVHLLIFPSIFSLQGGPLAFSVIISFSENSNVVWRVKWPTV